MTKLPSMAIDLADPESVREKLPGISEIVAKKRRAAVEAQEDFETWSQLLNRLRLLAGVVVRIEENDGDPDHVSPGALEAVVDVVELAGDRIQPAGVEAALVEEGNSVAGREAVFHTLVAASRAGLLSRVGPRVFASLAVAGQVVEMVPVPEAHLGLDGPPPQSKAEAALRVLGSGADRSWSAPEVAAVMAELAWIGDVGDELASLASTLSRLHAERKIHRPSRGQYQLSPPNASEVGR
jgi:hypothetical protein